MKWLTTILPYLAVGIGLFWIQPALIAVLCFHFAIILSLILARSPIPLKVLFKSRSTQWVILSILLCGSSGIFLYFFWSSFEVVSDLSVQIESLGLTGSTWSLFITYFVFINPLVEEYFWRGYLGSTTKSPHPSDFA